MAQAAKILKDPALDAPSAAKIAAFAGVLRANGFAVGLAESRDALAVVASPAGRRPALLKPALRALFSATREDWRRFDELFDAFWRGTGLRRVQPLGGAGSPSPARRKPLPSSFAPEAPHGAKESGARDDEAGGQSTSGDRRDAASSVQALAGRDIRHIVDPEEMAKTHALAERLAWRMRARLVRRWRARRAGVRLDLRRTIHRSVAHGGTPIDLVWRRRKLRPLRLVLLLDASGSMELYTAFFVRFLHAAVDAFREAEAFVFHTRLVHVSSALRERVVARAVDRLTLMARASAAAHASARASPTSTAGTPHARSIRAPSSSSSPTATIRAIRSGSAARCSAWRGDAGASSGSIRCSAGAIMNPPRAACRPPCPTSTSSRPHIT